MSNASPLIFGFDDLEMACRRVPAWEDHPRLAEQIAEELKAALIDLAESPFREKVTLLVEPIDMILHCPACGLQHIDAPEEVNYLDEGFPTTGVIWSNPPHRSHLCANKSCRHVWRPADVPTNGVAGIMTRSDRDSPHPKEGTFAESQAALHRAMVQLEENRKLRGVMSERHVEILRVIESCLDMEPPDLAILGEILHQNLPPKEPAAKIEPPPSFFYSWVDE